MLHHPMLPDVPIMSGDQTETLKNRTRGGLLEVGLLVFSVVLLQSIASVIGIIIGDLGGSHVTLILC